MRYMCNFILIVTFFTSTLTFAQDDKIPPAVPPQKAIPAPVPSSPAPTPAVRPSITVPKPEPQAAPAAAVAAKENAAKSPASGSAVSTMEAGLAASVLPRSAAQAPGLNLPRVYIPKDAYQIGIDDVLAISVIKPIPFITREIVTSDGNITFPYIGAVRAKGRTLADIQSEIQERLSSYMDYPVVSVSLLEARSKKFTIYGQVIRPGAYPVEANMSLLRAISLAGGLSVPGSTCMVKVLRTQKDGKSKSLIFQSEITAVLNGSKQDVVILPGDTVVVTIDKFFIYGEVNKPGSYYLEENMSLLDAITMAGSFIERGSTGVVRLSRAKGGEITLDIKDILGGKDRGVTIQAGDTINVTVDKFYIYGQIARPGAYPVRNNMSIMYAITAAGGLIQSGSMGRIKLFRAKPEAGEGPVFESDIKSILSGDNQNVRVRAGDTIVVSLDKFFVTGQVNHPGAYPVEEHMSLINAITTAGGLAASSTSGKIKLLRSGGAGGKQEAFETDFSSVLSGNVPDITIRPLDTIVVTADNFYVYGEVNRPGMYPLGSKTTALAAISMAGGFTRFGSAGKVKILRMNDKTGAYGVIRVNIKAVTAGNSKVDVPLLPGDVVVVSEGVF